MAFILSFIPIVVPFGILICLIGFTSSLLEDRNEKRNPSNR